MTGLPHNYYARFQKVTKKLDDLEQEPGFGFILGIYVFHKSFRRICLILSFKSGNAECKLAPV